MGLLYLTPLGGDMATQDEGPILKHLLELTGLPEAWVRSELENLLVSLGQNADQIHQLSLDELRHALIHYLNSIDAEISGQENSPILSG